MNNTEAWIPATENGRSINSSVSIVLSFLNGTIVAKRRVFDSKNATNISSKGQPSITGTKTSKLSEDWQVYNQENSDLPWDMTRAVICDANNEVWVGTDNGVVSIKGDTWKIYNHANSKLKPTAYNPNITQSVRDIEVDLKNNKWIVIGWDVVKYDNNSWTVYDSINSPISWARKIFVDRSNNVWFTSWDGVIKYDGENWTVLNKNNSSLPSDKVLGVFVDSKRRVWIGTFEGNIMLDQGVANSFTDVSSPLSRAYISQGYEDDSGNLWFSLSKDKSSDAGIYVLKADGTWERVTPNDSMYAANSINHFLLDEEKNTLWISLNKVGVVKGDLKNKTWEVYTNQNSNVPSVHVEKIAKDQDGNIWAATCAGLIQLKKK